VDVDTDGDIDRSALGPPRIRRGGPPLRRIQI